MKTLVFLCNQIKCWSDFVGHSSETRQISMFRKHGRARERSFMNFELCLNILNFVWTFWTKPRLQTMDMFSKKAASTKECITPHKISLLVLICEICDRASEEVTPFRKYRHALVLLVLNLIQARSSSKWGNIISNCYYIWSFIIILGANHPQASTPPPLLSFPHPEYCDANIACNRKSLVSDMKTVQQRLVIFNCKYIEINKLHAKIMVVRYELSTPAEHWFWLIGCNTQCNIMLAWI